MTRSYVDPIEQAETATEPELAEAPVPKITKQERTKLKIQEKKKQERENLVRCGLLRYVNFGRQR
jgi:hypothetical protein